MEISFQGEHGGNDVGNVLLLVVGGYDNKFPVHGGTFGLQSY